MLSALESSSLVAASVFASVLILLLIRRFWLPGARHQHNDLIGWQIAFLGTTYAVIIAFMLANVWSSYRNAEANADTEANALLDVYRVAEGFSAPEKQRVQFLAKHYAELMLTDEWPAMRQGTFSSAAFQAVSDLWRAITGMRVKDLSEQAMLYQGLTDLANMSEHRRLRHLDSQSKLPAIFWYLLITGGVVVVLYSCLFDVESEKMHVLHVAAATFMISLVLVTIADVDGPYGGALRIQPTGFVTVLQSMEQGRETGEAGWGGAPAGYRAR